MVALASWALNASGLRVEDPSSGDVVGVRSAVSADAVRDLITGAEESFVTFGPLGVVVMVMLGVAVAERSGLFEALARRMLSGLSPRTVVLGVALGGVLGKFLSDSAYVVLIPLGAVAFRAVGRSPMLGMIVAFVSINAAGDANPLIAPGDALFASVATEAAQLVDKDVVVRATDNMYFTTVSAFVLAGTIALVVDKILTKREHHLIPDADLEAAAAQQVVAAGVDDATERRALKLTGLAVLAYATLIVFAMLPASSPLRGEGGAIVESTFMNAIAVFLTVFFLLIGAVYGRLTGRISGSRAIPEFMADGVRSIAPLLVLFFAVSQFLALFPINPTVAGAAGEMISSGSDVNRFLDALVRGKLLRPAQQRELMRTRPTGNPDGRAYGLGLESRPLPCGGLYWGHTGDFLGYETAAGATIDGSQATVMVNLGPGASDAQSDDVKAAVQTALCEGRSPASQ
ncbi:AbgT family transporter [Streptomyces sp. NPDC006365]|uniref:AbgT family transporter n=1 Tax=Streptomyces sp. NPDC006365 TaxID=3364744 RepID=UPI003673B8A7